MRRNSIINFVCSFIFSLLAVTAANKVFFDAPDTPETNSDSRKKPQPLSISLFSGRGSLPDTGPALFSPDKAGPEVTDLSAIEALTAATPEISLSPLPTVNSENEGLTALAENDNIVEPAPETEKAPAKDVFEDNEARQPAGETAAAEAFTAEPVSTDLAFASEIILEDEISEQENLLKKHEESGIVYADISDTLADEQKAETKVPAAILYAPEDLPGSTAEDNPENGTKSLRASGRIVVAEAGETEVPAEIDSIPLVEDNSSRHKSISVTQTAGASQVAMLEPNELVSSIGELEEEEEKNLAEADLKQDEWIQMSDTAADSPWVVAKGNKFAKNQAAVEQFAGSEPEEEKELKEALNPGSQTEKGKETKVAYQMIQNLLIPIPEDIANDSNLTPQLSITPDDKNQKAPQEAKPVEKNELKAKELNKQEKESGLFKSITSWFSGDKKKTETPNGKEPAQKSAKSKISSFFGIGSSNDAMPATQIMPAELRLSFQPNRAEISGQTLRWIHAFADNARDNDNLYIEIRIDGTSSFALQQKRLNLLSTIFANRGVDYRKINIVFTSREPNSFIIRNIRFNNDEEVAADKKAGNTYYQPW